MSDGIFEEVEGHEHHERHEKEIDHEKHESHEKHEIDIGHDKSTKILYAAESYRIQGAIFEVYKELVPGFLEAVYQESLEHELKLQGIPFVPQVSLALAYKNEPLHHTYRADFVCFGSIIIEIKACSVLLPVHRAQVLNYLKATGMKLGLLVNFNTTPKVVIERIVL